MHEQRTDTLKAGRIGISGLRGVRDARTRPHQQGRAWRGRIALSLRPLIVAAALLAAVIGAASLPHATQAAQLGTNWSVRVSTNQATSVGTALSRQQFATARVTFTGAVAPETGRTTATIVLRRMSGQGATTVGSVVLRMNRVFNTQPTSLTALFSLMDATPQSGTRYTIAVVADGVTLTSTAFTLAR